MRPRSRARGSYHSSSVCELPLAPPAPTVTAGTPSEMAMFESVEEVSRRGSRPTARVAAEASRTSGESGGVSARRRRSLALESTRASPRAAPRSRRPRPRARRGGRAASAATLGRLHAGRRHLRCVRADVTPVPPATGDVKVGRGARARGRRRGARRRGEGVDGCRAEVATMAPARESHAVAARADGPAREPLHARPSRLRNASTSGHAPAVAGGARRAIALPSAHRPDDRASPRFRFRTRDGRAGDERGQPRAVVRDAGCEHPPALAPDRGVGPPGKPCRGAR